ncbi:hypothetical protein K8O92_25905 [Nocardia asteroides]|nr:hypothetical protein [Streptomyces gardneri]UAK31237.1 hypothetical protein K8O92_25905 [Nocardia asteroides]
MTTHSTFRGRPRQEQSRDVLPLAVPAMLIASVMLVGALVGLTMLPGWAHDYGPELVYSALLIYLGLALQLWWWGLTLWRTRANSKRDSTS